MNINFQNLNKKTKLLEQDLMSQLFSNLSKTPKAMARLSQDDLTYYKDLYGLFIDCYKNNKDPLIEISAKNLQLGDMFQLFSGRDVADICRDIKLLNNLRATYGLLETSLKDISEDKLDEFIAELQRKLVKSNASMGIETSSSDSVIAEYRELQTYYKERFKIGGGLIGISTGYEKLDEIIDGLRKGHLWVIGGYTSMGKTACALNIVSNIIKQKKRVIFYSLEMTKTDILSRLLGIMTNQNGLSILKGFKHNEEAVSKAITQIQESSFSIYSEKNELAVIESSMLEEHLTKNVDLFVVDFLQLVNVKGTKSEYETISTAILELQQTAQKLKVPIIVLSQISNEGAKYNSETVMSFKGSGSIASAADLAIEINIGETDKSVWKQKMYQSESVKMIWNVRKNRHGKVGSLDMLFTGQTGIFEKDPNPSAIMI